MPERIQVVQATNVRLQRRKGRRPAHYFNVKHKAFEICPFMIAPVLPGESLTNLLLQARAVTDPIHNPLIGWWLEYFYFYVPFSALMNSDLDRTLSGVLGTDLASMVLSPSTDLRATYGAAANSVPFYTAKATVNVVPRLLEIVTNFKFRDEGHQESFANMSLIENYPGVYYNRESWLHSLKTEAEGADDAELAGVDELEELDILPGFTGAYAEWEIMRDQGMIDVTYEDFLRSYGVNVPKGSIDPTAAKEEKLPELIRYVRKWQYPSNTVDPTDGSVASAVSWSNVERADKVRFFKEPGYLFGVSVLRPKIYLGSQKGNASALLSNFKTWLPSVLNGLGYTGVAEELDSATDGILQNQTVDYWWDVADLFTHGDQFVNHAMSAAANHGIALPKATLGDEADLVPTAAMANSLFVTAGSEYVRQDGVNHLTILGRISDTTK